MHVESELRCEGAFLVIGLDTVRAIPTLGLNHKLRACCKTRLRRCTRGLSVGIRGGGLGTALVAVVALRHALGAGAEATIAVAHSILSIAYHLLTEGTVYRDLGANYDDERDRQAVERRLVHRLQGLGYTVSLEPAA